MSFCFLRRDMSNALDCPCRTTVAIVCSWEFTPYEMHDVTVVVIVSFVNFVRRASYTRICCSQWIFVMCFGSLAKPACSDNN